MANELTKKEESAVAVLQSTSLGDIIKPLVKEIYLFDSYIAGTTHIPDKSVLTGLKVGEMLQLQREQNEFDDNAIMILTDSGIKVGYVPEKDNIVFARLMDAGKLLKAKITRIDYRDSFTRIGIGIYLIDF